MDARMPDIEEAATPMLAQYFEMKRAAGEALLFYRMGDFYELFFEDAALAASALDIALTKRGKHRGEDVPMCGVPAHSYESYLARLVKKGFKVAICEQVESPEEAKKRGVRALVRRDIVRVVTPGTLTEEALLDPARNNFLGALAVLGGAEAALAWADISTGELFVRETSLEDFAPHAGAAGLSELIVPDADTPRWRAALADVSEVRITPQPSTFFDSRAGEKRFLERFGVAALDAFGDFTRAETAALGALLAYVALTQRDKAPALRPPRKAEQSRTMTIDAATRASLEIIETRAGERDGSLLAAIDRTLTTAGARLLARRLAAPLTDAAAINERLDAVGAFFCDDPLREKLRHTLKRMPDMARALSRLALTRGGPRDVAAIRDGLLAAREAARGLSAAGGLASLPECVARSVEQLEARNNGGFSELIALLREALAPDLPLFARDGGFVARDFDPALDEARSLRDETRRVVAGLEARYREATAIRSLKVRHNNVLGYFIETPPSAADVLLSPPHDAVFIHRQTLAGAVRFTTAELAEIDSKIARAGDEALARELEIFERLVAAVLARAQDIGAAAEAAAELDVAASIAELARTENYARPVVDSTLTFRVEGGRHPVVEQALRKSRAGKFVPNDCTLGQDDEAKLGLVTGPNMAGKSTYLRQNALIALLAQAGSFVPARAAQIGVADRIFSRVGAADELARGRSTFMVEMIETAAILNQASARSLVILDEIGRGTSTFDGMAIAWASAEHLHDVNRCRGLFATHFHELTALSERLPRLSNLCMRVREWKGDVVFLHEVAHGPADRSYGVAVAKLAGLPLSVVERARAVLSLLERRGDRVLPLRDLPLFATAAPASDDIASPYKALIEALAATEPDRLSPREALEALYRLRALADELREPGAGVDR
jgi:DNA mismatch repair protein MutS